MKPHNHHHNQRLDNRLSQDPYTVSVYPIQQEPGLWFATYMIAEYRNGAERIVANVAMRHDTHRTEARACLAARRAGERAAARLRLR
ncbi:MULTISPECIES: isochorismatase [Cupriavidus]|uniref:Isochorismatase n=1 Tax=Cupriavidus oxalaticus TaxID=96344 RepID=A0A4P7LEL5_9BURK|nr:MULTISPECIES: isochorismatase [Cupriavidus]MBF6986257.1 isochorismatase [Cupriavidus sp. IK-TO18]QBY50241.1 isochorismatase [Cupriavidus oxalaticus]